MRHQIASMHPQNEQKIACSSDLYRGIADCGEDLYIMLLTDEGYPTHNVHINSVCRLGGIRGQRIYLTLTHWEPFEKFASRRVFSSV